MKKTKKVKAKIEEYLKKPYKIEIIPDPEGGFVAQIPELPGCITQGETLKEVMEMIEDAKRAWIEAAIENNITIPEPFELRKFSGKFVVRVPKSLHKKLVETAEKEGVSLNTLIVKLLSEALSKKEEKTKAQTVIVYSISQEKWKDRPKIWSKKPIHPKLLA